MEEKLTDLAVEGSLIEELSDEELAACVGGCDITLGLLDTVGINIPTPILKVLGVGLSANVSGVVDAELDPNGSNRSWSDRNVKEHFAPVDPQQILETVANLPITSWNYKEENSSVRHIGPMAQDFAAAFGVGDSDRYIYNVDANGVALAAIQALYGMLQQKDAQLDSLRAEVEQLKQAIALPKAA